MKTYRLMYAMLTGIFCSMRISESPVYNAVHGQVMTLPHLLVLLASIHVDVKTFITSMKNVKTRFYEKNVKTLNKMLLVKLFRPIKTIYKTIYKVISYVVVHVVNVQMKL